MGLNLIIFCLFKCGNDFMFCFAGGRRGHKGKVIPRRITINKQRDNFMVQ